MSGRNGHQAAHTTQTVASTPTHAAYPPIADYALISDCRSAALVHRNGSIDWWCAPRVDSASCFGRLLDWHNGGYCSIEPADPHHSSFRSYVEGSMVLSTIFSSAGGEARLVDCLVVDEEDTRRCRLVRIIEGVRGRVDFHLALRVRFDYAEVKPWLRYQGRRLYRALGGSDGLVITSDAELERDGRHDLVGAFTVRAQERLRLCMEFVRPTESPPAFSQPRDVDAWVDGTVQWWQRWSGQISLEGIYRPGVIRSALALKALSQRESGAIVAAATTSLPESPHGHRNWDYRYSWIRDSSFSVRSLTDIGCFLEAEAFRRFIQRSAAGSAAELQIMYGPGGERRLTEIELPLDGYGGARPVRIGNLAASQLQMDAYGELLELTWRWHLLGHSPDDDYWRFLYEVVEMAVDRWSEPDHGLWEIRGEPQHFVHSKVMCWAAIDRGLRLAEHSMRKIPTRRWESARAAVRRAIDTKGYDAKRGTYRQAFGSANVDAALLLLPSVGFVDYDDERMIGTVTAVREELEADGLVLRYRTAKTDDGVGGREGSFLACTFWLAECLARQGQLDAARVVFDRALATGNDLGLFAEEYDQRNGEMLGNFPQALTHLSHISAAVALTSAQMPSTESNVIQPSAELTRS
ncbi:MAG TPA: glycoside hydrolase family 15 protein [Candidatus Dormibacteraeota bacterium]|nr:glycoside hydrolase family 15 protein [Candidatus Dormibacteraeota bacterium]